MATPATYGLTHLAIAVNDVERTLGFYTAVFDMEVMYHEPSMIQLTTPGCHDILVFEKRTGADVGQSAGIGHFGFRLKQPNEIDAMREKIVKAGGVIIEEGEFVQGSPFIFFKDPDGYIVEVWYELLPS